MANKRMFSKEIVNSDAFLDMPMSTQLLYFHLNMVADDDGFVSAPKRIMRMIGASEDDIKLLIAKAFVLSSELWKGVVVIKHWRINNILKSDRYKPTVYSDEKAMIELKKNGAYTWKKAAETLWNQNGTILEPQNSIEKNSIEKVRDYNEITQNAMNGADEIAMIPVIDGMLCNPTIQFVGLKPTKEEVELYCKEHKYTFDVNEFYEYYDEVNWTMSDSRHSFNWKKKCDLWQRNEIKKKDNSKKVAVPDFMKDQAEGKIKESKNASKELIEQVKAMQSEMKEGEA